MPDFSKIPPTLLYHTKVDLSTGNTSFSFVVFLLQPSIQYHPSFLPSFRFSVVPFQCNIIASPLTTCIYFFMTGRLISHAPAAEMENMIIEHPHPNPNHQGTDVR